METALRRQLGVDAVDIDTRESTCVIAFQGPKDLDFSAMESAAADANYVLTGITLSAEGEVVSEHCDECGEDVNVFVLPGTGQRLELGRPHEIGKAEIRLSVLDWNSEHRVLVKPIVIPE